MHICGQDVKATDGTTAPIKKVLPVNLSSEDVKTPRELEAGRTRGERAKQALRPFATALRGILGPDGSPTLQGAGTEFWAIPGFSETMGKQHITAIGALQHFLELFPEFVIEGKAPKASARLV